MIGLLILSLGCGKDDKATSPEEHLPTVTVTLDGDDISFGAYSATYTNSVDILILIFAQGPSGGYPTATAIVSGADAVETGVEVACDVSVYLDSTTAYVCGNTAQNDSAVANVSFSTIELTEGGLLSGDVTGMAERTDHPEEALRPLLIQFRNIPL